MFNFVIFPKFNLIAYVGDENFGFRWLKMKKITGRIFLKDALFSACWRCLERGLNLHKFERLPVVVCFLFLVPKLLLHRLFPNVRYSIWIDGKLQLVVDPYQLLERFLWRHNATFAISKHYRRFDVFEEAEANKAAGKYNNASIDYQINFYRNEGLTPYSEAKLPIISDVPEGCVIIKEHIPITNLFTCLWFNEVDRFTSRDQLSFATVRDKIMARVNWSINMFMDCERRNFVIQAYHRDLLEHMPPPAAKTSSLRRARVNVPITVPTPVRGNTSSAKNSLKKNAVKRGKGERRSRSRRHVKNPGNKDNMVI
ncbi:hypothetical protein Hanom_Chr11g00986521 [Helianthus anomalus]